MWYRGASSCLIEHTEQSGRNRLSFLRSVKFIWILTRQLDSFADRNWRDPLRWGRGFLLSACCRISLIPSECVGPNERFCAETWNCPDERFLGLNSSWSLLGYTNAALNGKNRRLKGNRKNTLQGKCWEIWRRSIKWTTYFLVELSDCCRLSNVGCPVT